jgi:hypothetical protein
LNWIYFIKYYISLYTIINNLCKCSYCISLIIIKIGYLYFCLIYFICIILTSYIEIYFYLGRSCTYFSLWCWYHRCCFSNWVLCSYCLYNLFYFFIRFTNIYFLLKFIINIAITISVTSNNLCCFNHINNLWINWLITCSILFLYLCYYSLYCFFICILYFYIIW